MNNAMRAMINEKLIVMIEELLSDASPVVVEDDDDELPDEEEVPVEAGAHSDVSCVLGTVPLKNPSATTTSLVTNKIKVKSCMNIRVFYGISKIVLGYK
jgi:hypothetical protein